MKKDSDPAGAVRLRPIWQAYMAAMGWKPRRRDAIDGLYQRTVVVFWKPRARNPCREIGRVLQFK